MLEELSIQLKIMSLGQKEFDESEQKDPIDSYFECVTACSIQEQEVECVTRCVEVHLKSEFT